MFKVSDPKYRNRRVSLTGRLLALSKEGGNGSIFLASVFLTTGFFLMGKNYMEMVGYD